jgi:hypothetical protein
VGTGHHTDSAPPQNIRRGTTMSNSSPTTVFTDSPLSEMWSHFGRFELVSRVRSEFGVSEESAEAIGDCVRQARALFRSAHDSPLLTRPILLYYGMVSLSKLFLLLDADHPLSMEEIESYEKDGHGLRLTDSEASTDYALEESVVHFPTNNRKGGITTPRGMFLQLADRVSPGAADAWIHHTLKFGDLLGYVPQLDDLVRDLLKTHRGYLGTFPDMRWAANEGHQILLLRYFSPESEPRNLDEAVDRLAWISQSDYPVEADPIDNVGTHLGGYGIRYRETLPLPMATREEFAAVARVYPPAIHGVRFESLLAEYVLLYALSIVARYKPHRWARILEGRESPLLPILERLMWVGERWWPNLVLNRLTGQEVCFTQPALATPVPGGSL